LLPAVGAKTTCIEIGTAVIDMRHENPIYMAEDAGAVRTRRTGPGIDFPH
jgi:alkanesulfonate monooxygenase SsuD/methylene tetrahydromethanopterin reductase-like flavin-dependent oxidoreductase (luciferase family)